MTPVRAKQIAEENGCRIFRNLSKTGYWISRKVGEKVYEKTIKKDNLASISEPDFIAFYLPDERD